MWWIWIVAVLVLLVVVWMWMIFPGRVSDDMRRRFAHKNYAHRGFHDNEKEECENSLLAFSLAAKKGYGSELDVQLTKDGQVVVFHDDDFVRSSGLDKKVCELDYEEIKKIKLFKSEKERVPLFSEMLEVYGGAAPLIVELKYVAEVSIDELCRKTAELLDAYKGEYCIESFNPIMVQWFKKNRPGVVRGQLAMAGKNYPTAVMGIFLPRLLLNFLARPHFIAYCHNELNCAYNCAVKFGAMGVMWTVKNESEYEEAKKQDAIIFEGFSPESCY